MLDSFTLKSYTTWIPGAQVQIWAKNKQRAYELAKTVEGYKTSHCIRCDNSMERASNECIVLIPE